eukprot:TRINITY_DN27986_c0_g1_i1.p1 TRINITY_DN27986_c0_g1~~TRINITY_DN27986_c0_g1_i1.p1  ORF type:complete len:605 (-),score=129.64 TRINITY_DN27986_c0_g1_i1:163-1743(-)
MLPETLTDDAKQHLFMMLDKDKSGSLCANELMAVLLQCESTNLDEISVNQLICELDLEGESVVQRDAFDILFRAPKPPKQPQSPHLVLYFDVNQTVIMIDSVTGAGVTALLNEVIANTCWGRVVKDEADATLQRWEPVSKRPELHAPEPNLKTYCQFVRSTNSNQEARKLSRRFASAGSPGEHLASFVAELDAAIRIPETVLKATDAAVLKALGLHEGYCVLLRSFLVTIRELKRAGRSFSICFRTFGADLGKIVAEFNALCEGRHPYFHDEPGAAVVLDGSDGHPDMRLDLSAGSSRCGTWVRDGDRLSLVMGTIEQPPIEQASGESLSAFYAAKDTEGTKHEIVGDGEKARDRLRDLLHTPGQGRAVALRDYYPGWAAKKMTASGGKPMFLETDDLSVLQIFFDDHILPGNAKIVDVRRADQRVQLGVPMAAVFGLHLIRAEPLRSITEPNYFLDAVIAAEDKWRLRCANRRELAEAIVHVGAVVASFDIPASLTYMPFKKFDCVLNTTDVTVGMEEDEQEADV